MTDCPRTTATQNSHIADLARALYLADREALLLSESDADLVAADEASSEAYDALIAAVEEEMGNGL